MKAWYLSYFVFGAVALRPDEAQEQLDVAAPSANKENSYFVHVAPGENLTCAAIDEKVSSALRSDNGSIFRLNGSLDAGTGGTYISWLPALKEAISKKPGEPGVLWGTHQLPHGTLPTKVKDVGGKAQKNWANSSQNKEAMKKLFKVDLDKGEFGLLTGGPYARRQATAMEYNQACSCSNFLPLYPSDETKFTMEAAVPAWTNVYRANGGNGSPCPLVVLMAGSTDLHVGTVSDKVEKTFTIIDYKTTEPDCFVDGVPRLCTATMDFINEEIRKVGMTVLGGSTEFKLKPVPDKNGKLPKYKDYLQDHGGTDGNAFVILTQEVLSELPHAAAPGLELSGTVFLAARG